MRFLQQSFLEECLSRWYPALNDINTPGAKHLWSTSVNN